MENPKTVGNYDGHHHFILKRAMEDILNGNAYALILYKKVDSIVRNVNDETKATLHQDAIIVEVID